VPHRPRATAARATPWLLLAGALVLLAWPALVNGYPLLFPDTLDYLAQGHAVLYALLHTHHPEYNGMRSALYSLAIYPFHLNRTPWPILSFHAAMIVYPAYLTVRTFSPSNALTKTAILLATLSAVTSLAFYISLLMPDILGGACYLALFLLAFAFGSLTRMERGVLAEVVIVGATAHTTHLILAILICVAFTLLKPALKATLTLTPVLITVGAAILLQLAINTLLTGHASLDGNRPPYLEARLLADGPGAQYLHEHCPDARLPYLCAHLNALPPNDDEFLWSDTGLWATATDPGRAELLHEERPLALAVAHTYPAALLRVSVTNFSNQLLSFGLDDFDNNDYMQAHLDDVLRNGRPHYDNSLQSRNAIPWKTVTLLQDAVVALSCGWLLVSLPRASRRLRALYMLVVGILIANAALTGILSEVDSRYQARVIWLLPFVAAIALLQRLDRNHRDRAPA
jgi:hypothetical protein